MNKPRRPRLTLKAINGLTRALGYIEADDLTDDSEEQSEELKAAGEWLAAMWQFFPDEDKPS